MATELTDDIYVFTYFDQEENTLSMGIAESLEEFQVYQKAFSIIGWGNITGTGMEITEFHADTDLELVEKATRINKK